MRYSPLATPPAGLLRPATPNMSPGYWYDGNLVRWVNGAIGAIGGSERIAQQEFASTARASFEWRDAEDTLWVAYLCDGHLYAVSEGKFLDISPTPALVAPETDFLAGGYGDDEYSKGTYGTPRGLKPGFKRIGPAFTLSNYGTTLLAMSSVDGRLLQWDPATPNVKAAKVANSPVGRCFVVTPERHVMVFGAETPDNFRWCDEEDITNWNLADIAGKAGEYQVQPTAPIISAVPVTNGILFMTTYGVNIVRYIGLPYIYNWEPIYKGAAPTSHACVVPFNNGAMWMAGEDFYQFDGVNVVPVATPLKDWISDTVDFNTVRFRAAAVDIGEKPEIWWFVTTPDSTENGAVIIYNYNEGWWSKGMMGRSCGHSSTYTSYPVMCKGKRAYKHESGKLFTEVGELPWAETGPFGAGRGSVMSMLRRVMLDVGNRPKVSFVYSEFRSGRGQEKRTIPVYPDDKGVLQPRISARDFRMRLETGVNGDEPWTFGEPLIDVAARGTRGRV